TSSAKRPSAATSSLRQWPPSNRTADPARQAETPMRNRSPGSMISIWTVWSFCQGAQLDTRPKRSHLRSMDDLQRLISDPRVFVRNQGTIDVTGDAVVYWMQRAQRAEDNAALDLAIDVANLLGKPVVAFLGVVPFYPHGNGRHYRFLADGLTELAAGLAARRVAFVLRRHPDHSLLRFVDEVRPCLVVGDENPLREPESWRRRVASRLRVLCATVDADVVVPARLFSARGGGRLHAAAQAARAALPQF